jgi:hypothetical protein
MQLVTKVDTCVSMHLHILQPIGLLMSCLHIKLGRLVFLLDIFGFKRFGWEINLRIIRPELKKTL